MSIDDFAAEANAPDTPDLPPTSSPTRNTRCVKDPIHRLITLSNRAWSFVDTKQFQRLRHVKQLGTSYYVWSGASHNRFEHCLGVAHLARLMASHLQKNQPELGITDRDVECVELAGLCHDLGHGPWSHVWDGMFIPAVAPTANWQHEMGSDMMFKYLVEDNEIQLPETDYDFIRKLISGLRDDEPCPSGEKRFLFDIVANKRNGLDVDKFDYILRDSHMIGDPKNVDLPRMLQSARVIDDQICYDIKDANHIYEICAMRFKLHKIVYNHKSAKAIEYMIIDGLIAAEPYMHIVDRINHPEQYVHLTDNILTTIEETTQEELAPARAILNRIRTRNLYKMVDYKAIDWPHREKAKQYITPEKIVEAAKRHHKGLEVAQSLTKDFVIVDFSMMHYGMKQHNPLDFVKFYSKNQRNVSRKAERGDYSTLMPEYHAEVLTRVFTKENKYFGIIQAGYRACLQELKDDIDRAEAEALAEQQVGASASLQQLKNFLGQLEGNSESTQPGYQACLQQIKDFMHRLEADPVKDVSFDATAALGFDDEDMDGDGFPVTHSTPPQVDAPSTPKMEKRAFSRQPSLSFSANNSFTTVPPDFSLPSPSRGVKKAKPESKRVVSGETPALGLGLTLGTGKRAREDSIEAGDESSSGKRAKPA